MSEQPEVMVEVDFPDGTWEVPARVIADHRARYYAEQDPDTTYDEEFAFTMGDDYELTDWAANNMDWSDLAPHARKKANAAPIDYEREWANADRRVVRP